MTCDARHLVSPFWAERDTRRDTTDAFFSLVWAQDCTLAPAAPTGTCFCLQDPTFQTCVDVNKHSLCFGMLTALPAVLLAVTLPRRPALLLLRTLPVLLAMLLLLPRRNRLRCGILPADGLKLSSNISRGRTGLVAWASFSTLKSVLAGGVGLWVAA